MKGSSIAAGFISREWPDYGDAIKDSAADGQW